LQPLYTRGKGRVFCMSSFMFLDSRQEDHKLWTNSSKHFLNVMGY
jgi:hypothetical protein